MDASPRLRLDRVHEDETKNGMEAWTRPMAAGTFDLAARMSDAAGAVGMSDATGAAEQRGCPTALGRRGFSWRRQAGRQGLDAFDLAAEVSGCGEAAGICWVALVGDCRPRRPELGSEAAAAGVGD
jgi:hypothetical protein